MDRRHYTSMLLLAGIVAIAWVLAKVQPKAGGVSLAEHSPVLLQTGARTPEANIPVAPEVESAALTASPLIPGLLDDGPSAEFQLADGANLSARSSPLPLRTISNESKQGEPPNTEAQVAQDFLADGSTPRVRSFPAFSMPNTQNPILNRPRNLGPDNLEPSKPGEHSGTPRPLGMVSSLQEPGNSLSPTRLPPENSGNHEPSYQPLKLPNNRHVLRPIVRGQPLENGDRGSVQQTVPAHPSLGSPTRSDTGTSDTGRTADWDGPMPGVRVRPEATRETGIPASNPQEPTRQETLPPNPRFAPPANSNSNPASAPSESSDPLFAVAVQDLYRLPSEQRASGAGVLPTTTATTAGHSLGHSPRINTPLRPRTPPPRPGGGRPSSDYIWHVIQPNQSLEAISFQYFGDDAGTARLLEFNTDVLENPKLLPVGKAIRIPIR